jgi:hypothetical protein
VGELLEGQGNLEDAIHSVELNEAALFSKNLKSELTKRHYSE